MSLRDFIRRATDTDPWGDPPPANDEADARQWQEWATEHRDYLNKLAATRNTTDTAAATRRIAEAPRPDNDPKQVAAWLETQFDDINTNTIGSDRDTAQQVRLGHNPS